MSFNFVAEMETGTTCLSWQLVDKFSFFFCFSAGTGIRTGTNTKLAEKKEVSWSTSTVTAHPPV